MKTSLLKIFHGYEKFRKKYAFGDSPIMRDLSDNGQKPKVMIVACCDSRVDPALILQCDPGDLFVVRNVANIIPPYEPHSSHNSTSAALEFGIRFLKIAHLIILGHSQCGGIKALLMKENIGNNDFISKWVSLIKLKEISSIDCDDYARLGLYQSSQNCLTFPWIKGRLLQNKLLIHRWFFDIKSAQIFAYSEDCLSYAPLSGDLLKKQFTS